MSHQHSVSMETGGEGPGAAYMGPMPSGETVEEYVGRTEGGEELMIPPVTKGQFANFVYKYKWWIGGAIGLYLIFK